MTATNKINEMEEYKGTYVCISRTDNQTTSDIINKLIHIGVNKELININKYNELVISVPENGLGLPLMLIKANVIPACVRVFDSYLTDINGEERVYYSA